MLINPITTVVFLITLCSSVVAVWYWNWSVVTPWSVLLIFVVVKIYASVFIDSNFYIKTFCHGDRRENRIALTFDDGPIYGNTERILKILKEKNVRATFFCIGKHIEKSEGLPKQIDADGHIIANHSY